MADLPSGTPSSRPRPVARPFVGPAKPTPVPPPAHVGVGSRSIGAPFAPKARQIAGQANPVSDTSVASSSAHSAREQLAAPAHGTDEGHAEMHSVPDSPATQGVIVPETAPCEESDLDHHGVEGAEGDEVSLSDMSTWSSGEELPAYDSPVDVPSPSEETAAASLPEMPSYDPPVLERFSAPEDNISVDYPSPQVPMALEASAWEWGPSGDSSQVGSAAWDRDTPMSSVSEAPDEFQGDVGAGSEEDEENANEMSTFEDTGLMAAAFYSEEVSDSAPPPAPYDESASVSQTDGEVVPHVAGAGTKPHATGPAEASSELTAGQSDDPARERIASLLERLASRIRKGEISLEHSANVASETAVLASLLTVLLSEAL